MNQLKAYRSKRDLDKTREPAGDESTAKPAGRRYVLHKHDASQLHYDLRLEQNGVLRSWAVPKGPSLEVGVKRLAVEVENHPLEYGDFEGVIPKDAYGGGTVMVWDRGEWESAREDKGKNKDEQIDFVLHGEKLTGAWTLVRMSGQGNKRKDNKKQRNWLLLKRHDPEQPAHDAKTLDGLGDQSVLSGHSMERIAADRDDRVNRSDDEGRQRRPAQTQDRASRRGASAATVAGVRLTHPQRVVYPEMGVTKLDLARHFEAIQDWIVPVLADRPVSLLRCLDGQAGECFFQKHPGDAIPDHLPRITITEKKGPRDYVYVHSIADLIGLIQAGTLELHVWGSRIDDIERPDTLVFDLDPAPDVAWKETVRVARDFGERLQDLGLTGFLRTTGGKGLHLVVPLTRKLEWDDAKAFAHAVAQQHARSDPKRLTTNMSKDKRRGRIYIDYLRNDRGATAIASYSPRAREGAPVAVPIRWDELSPALHSDRYHIGNLRRRLSALDKDPWAGFAAARRPITKKMRRAVGVD